MLNFWGPRRLTEGEIENKEDNLFLPFSSTGAWTVGPGEGGGTGGGGETAKHLNLLHNILLRRKKKRK